MAAESTHSDTPTNEKAEGQQTQQEQAQPKPKKGLFSKKTKAADAEPSEKTEKAADSTIEGAPAAPKKDVPPASFASLFRCVPSRHSAVYVLNACSPQVFHTV